MEPERTPFCDTDEEITSLAESARRGDLNALEMLTLRLRSQLFTVAYRELSHYEDAQDAVAAALLRICCSVQQMRQPDKAKAWTETIVRNEARRIGAERGRRRSREADLEKYETSRSHSDRDFVAAIRLDIHRALRTLPFQQARAAFLYYLEENTVAQIAAQLGRPTGTIKYWLHLGRAHLALEMKEYAPVKTTEPVTNPSVAVIASDENDDTLQTWTTALNNAGWEEVRTTRDFAALVRTENSPLMNARYLVLDQVGGRSAFEAWPILRSRVANKNLISLLLLETALLDASITEALVLSGYVSGFDFCLMKPLDPQELTSFARKARQLLDAEPKTGQ